MSEAALYLIGMVAYVVLCGLLILNFFQHCEKD